MSLLRNKKTRPIVIVLSILAVIAVSMLGVTLSAYIKQINLFDGGWIGPKYFAFEIDSDSAAKSLAPGESVDYDFDVRNFNEEGTAQVDLHVSIEIGYPAQLAGTGVIKADLYHDGALLASDTGSGSLAVTGSTLPGGTDTTDRYTLTLTWQDMDMEYLGEIQSGEFDASDVNISVSAYQ